MNKYKELLLKILFEKEERDNYIKQFQNLVWDLNDESEATKILKEIAYDLDYYESNTTYRLEENTLYDEKRLEKEIDFALERLKKILEQ